MKTAYLVLGNQLLHDHPAASAKPGELVIMVEAHDLCAKLRYHKHKLILILSAMRNYRDYLVAKGIRVEYVEVGRSNMFMAELRNAIAKNSVMRLEWMRPCDVAPQDKLVALCKMLGITHHIHANRQFMTKQSDFEAWHESQKQPLMESFYRWQRRRTGILVSDGKPEGGIWNYDSENRKPLLKVGLEIPPIPQLNHDKNTRAVMAAVDAVFPANPGAASDFWLPTSFDDADAWLGNFIRTKLCFFGPYEDASRRGEAFLFHSALSPLMNCGLLSPEQVVEAALKAYRDGQTPLNSTEGFIRQIIGWREYMYGMYLQNPSLMDANYFGFSKELESWWYDDTYRQQPLPLPVLSVLQTTHAYGYNHHIERLMVLGNWFLLNEYNPRSVYRWFSSMYVNAYEWVMVPNVQGMSQYADGGVIATKPYISGGNYLQKMGRWWSTADEAVASDYTKLYWKFLHAHRDLLRHNFRMAMALKAAERMEK